jgi:hypothetical protein
LGVSFGTTIAFGFTSTGLVFGFVLLERFGGGGGGGGGGGAIDSVTSTAGMGISSTCQIENAMPPANARACSSTENVMMMRSQPFGAVRCWESIASNAM